MLTVLFTKYVYHIILTKIYQNALPVMCNAIGVRFTATTIWRLKVILLMLLIMDYIERSP
jgi:hypothetical protein